MNERLREAFVERAVMVADMSLAREERVKRQAEMQRDCGGVLISFTMNIAGAVKYTPLIERAFRIGVRRIEGVLRVHRVRVLKAEEVISFTGCERLWAVDASAEAVKAWMVECEERDALGRLFDADVIDPMGRHMTRGTERACLICGKPVRACARSRVHTAEELYGKAVEIIRSHVREEWLKKVGRCAERALLHEACVTPKPGLVDGRDSGAHGDMDIFTFVDSAVSLRDYFEVCARLGAEAGESEVFPLIRREGIFAEAEMLAATGNVNTHKGAIFSLGVLAAAAGVAGEGAEADEIFRCAAKVARASLEEMERNFGVSSGAEGYGERTGGEEQYIRMRLTGVRGEAAAGFPNVREIALPELGSALEAGMSLNDAAVHALLMLMVNVKDSNVIRRAGMGGLEFMRDAARRVIGEGESMEALARMNGEFISRKISPGGCADLLAAALFIWFLKSEITA